MKKLLCGVALMCGLAGCDSGPGLADVARLELVVMPGSRKAALALHMGSPYSSCDEISGDRIQAELDGMSMRLAHAGGHTESFSLVRGECEPPFFILEVPEGTASPTLDGLSTSVRLREGDTERVAEAEHVCVERRLRVVTPASGVVRSGEWVELAIEPGTDILGRVDVDWRPGASSDWTEISAAHALSLTSERIRFRAPAMSGTGPGSAKIWLLGNGAPALVPPKPRCEGFVECAFSCGADPVYFLSVPILVER